MMECMYCTFMRKTKKGKNTIKKARESESERERERERARARESESERERERNRAGGQRKDSQTTKFIIILTTDLTYLCYNVPLSNLLCRLRSFVSWSKKHEKKGIYTLKFNVGILQGLEAAFVSCCPNVNPPHLKAEDERRWMHRDAF